MDDYKVEKKQCFDDYENGTLIMSGEKCADCERRYECRFIQYAVEGLNELPSAQPEIIYCEDFKYADEKRIADGRLWCNLNNGYLSYCSEGERRTDE